MFYIQERMSYTISTWVVISARQLTDNPKECKLQKPSNIRLRTTLYPVGKGKPQKISPFIILPWASPGFGQRSETSDDSSNFSTLSSFLPTALMFSCLILVFFVFLWAECSEFLSRRWCRGGCLEDFPWLLLPWWLASWYSLVPHICWCFVSDHWRDIPAWG